MGSPRHLWLKSPDRAVDPQKNRPRPIRTLPPVMHTTPDAMRSELDLLNERCETLASGIRLRAWSDDEGRVTVPAVAADERGLSEAA